MIIGCVAFPFGWNSDESRKICGPESNRFELGLCGVRWAYPLAIIGKYFTIYITHITEFLKPNVNINSISVCLSVCLSLSTSNLPKNRWIYYYEIWLEWPIHIGGQMGAYYLDFCSLFNRLYLTTMVWMIHSDAYTYIRWQYVAIWQLWVWRKMVIKNR